LILNQKPAHPNMGENVSGGCWELVVLECQTKLWSVGNIVKRQPRRFGISRLS